MPPAPIYRPPKSLWYAAEELRPSLAGTVEAALWKYSPLRTAGVEIETEVGDGRVTLTGYVRSSTQKAMAGRLASAVPGVIRVENRLIADSELEVSVAEALAAIPEPAGAGRRAVVKSLAGRVVVHLDRREAGPDPEALSERLARAAGSVPGVREAGFRFSTPALVPAGPTGLEPGAEAPQAPSELDGTDGPEAPGSPDQPPAPSAPEAPAAP